MTDAPAIKAKTCPRCSAGFGCSTSGQCWCAVEPYRMPMPEAGATSYTDCLCRDCLREVATELGLAARPGG